MPGINLIGYNMIEQYAVTVAGDHLLFASAHFITYAGHQCESLHGHNYRAAVTASGPLSPDWYVVDFVALTRLATSVTDRLDHKMLLASVNPFIVIEQVDNQVTARYEDRMWSFPAQDCVLLPIENTTAELLARYIAQQILNMMKHDNIAIPDTLEVKVEEGIGVAATYIWRRA